MKNILFVLLILATTASVWGQRKPSKKFKAPKLYIVSTADTTGVGSDTTGVVAETSSLERGSEMIVNQEVAQERMNKMTADSEGGAPSVDLPDSMMSPAMTAAQWDILSAKLDSTLSTRLDSLFLRMDQLAATGSLPKIDTLVVLNSTSASSDPTTPPISIQQPQDYSEDFLLLRREISGLQKQLDALQATPVSPQSLVASTPAQANETQGQLSQLQGSVDQQRSYAVEQFAEIKKVIGDLDRRLDRLTVMSGANLAQGALSSNSPKVEVVVPPDTQLTQALMRLQQQPAQDTQAVHALSQAMETQQRLWAEQLSLKEQEQQRLSLQVTRLTNEKEALAKQAAKSPVVKRDTILRVKVDTLRIAPKIIGLNKTNVYFQRGATKLYAADEPLLKALAEQLKQHPEMVMHIRGYADNLSGSQALNLRLSDQRAQQVKTFFLQEGVAEAQLKTEAFGAQQPIYRNSLDRRVELEIIIARK